MKKRSVNRVTKTICRSEKSQGHRKVECEISPLLVMIN